MASATHVYRNGTILTMDSGGSQAQALAVRGETILAVGSDAEIMALADPHTVVTDLRGRTMLPGFIDGHSHFVSAGLMAATQLDLSSPPVGGVKNIAEGCGLGLCTGCFTGKYPAETPAVTEKSKFESKIPEATE